MKGEHFIHLPPYMDFRDPRVIREERLQRLEKKQLRRSQAISNRVGLKVIDGKSK